MTTFVAPTTRIRIGDVELDDNIISLDVIADRRNPLTLASLELSNHHGEWSRGIANRDTLNIQWAPDGGELKPLFDGSVSSALVQTRPQVYGLCRMRQLAEERRVVTYKREEAAAIVRHLTREADFTSRSIDELRDEVDKLGLHHHTIVEALKLLNQRMLIGHAFYTTPAGGFVWGPIDLNQEAVATIDLNDSELKFTLEPGGFASATIPGLPIRHSSVVNLIARGEEQAARWFVVSVRHTLGRGGRGARTRLGLQPIEEA